MSIRYERGMYNVYDLDGVMVASFRYGKSVLDYWEVTYAVEQGRKAEETRHRR